MIQQIRTGKDIDDLLQKSERRRDELKIELGSEKREELSSELERKKTAVSQAKGEGNNEIERRKRVDLV